MGRIVVTGFISLDGVVEAPAGEDFTYPNWSLQFDRGEKFEVDEALGAEGLLIGRRTYESFAGAWPQYEGPLAASPSRTVLALAADADRDPDRVLAELAELGEVHTVSDWITRNAAAKSTDTAAATRRPPTALLGARA